MDRGRAYNARKSAICCAHLLGQRFEGKDLFVTFGYLPGQEPRNRAAAVYQLKSGVIDPLRRLRRAQGVPFRYAYSTKWSTAPAGTEHRMILSAGRDAPDLLSSLWQYGPVVCRPLGELGPLEELVKRLYAEAERGAGPYEKPIIHSRGLY